MLRAAWLLLTDGPCGWDEKISVSHRIDSFCSQHVNKLVELVGVFDWTMEVVAFLLFTVWWSEFTVWPLVCLLHRFRFYLTFSSASLHFGPNKATCFGSAVRWIYVEMCLLQEEADRHRLSPRAERSSSHPAEIRQGAAVCNEVNLWPGCGHR